MDELADILNAVSAALVAIEPCFRLQAPQDTPLPYWIITPLGGRPLYTFCGAIEQYEIQVSRFQKWTGDTQSALDDYDDAIDALDRKAMTADGIIMYRLNNPRMFLEPSGLGHGKIIHVTQDLRWETYRAK